MAATFFILKAGIAPPDLAGYPVPVKLMFWSWIVDLGLKRKDWELARGLNAKGEPLPGIAPSTRKHRVSAMTPSGKGDPSAPYLMPGRGLSRTRSLLTGKAHADYAEFFWRYDAHTGDQWGRVLAWHAARGKAYDVVGLSPAGIASVAQQAQGRWRQFISSSPPMAQPSDPSRQRVSPAAAHALAGASGVDRSRSPSLGRTDLTHATFGIGGTREQAQRAIDEGRSSGFRTQAEWTKYFREKRPVGDLASPGTTSYSVRKGDSNVLLQAIWGSNRRRPPTTTARAAMPPVAPPKPRPKPAPKPAPPRPPVRTPADAAELAGSLGAKVKLLDVGEARSQFGDAQAGIPAYYHPGDGTIYFNPGADAWGHPAFIARQKNVGWLAGGSYEHLVHHEVGHWLHHRGMADGGDFGKMGRESFPGDVKSSIEEHVGRYAATNQLEFVAEVYAMLKDGRTPPREILDLYDSLGGVRP